MEELDENVEASSLSSFFRTNDGGATWERMAMPDTSHLFDIAFRDELVGYAAGTKGLLLKTEDGGLTWKKIETKVPFHLLKIAFSGSDIAVSGNAGTALRVTGEKAEIASTGAYFWLSSLDFNAKGRGILVGDHGLIMISEDGGKSWKNR